MENQVLQNHKWIEQDSLQFKARYSYSLNNKGEEKLEFELIVIDEMSIFIDQFYKPNSFIGDYLIVLSRHSAKSGKKALLVHTPGNFSDDNSAGGEKMHISIGSGVMNHFIYVKLIKYGRERENQHIGCEVTHHGPTEFNIPFSFIELGSSEEEWRNDLEAANILAKVVIEAGMALFEYYLQTEKKILNCVGFGGNHYMSNLEKVVPAGMGFCHVIPKYKLQYLSLESIKNIVNQSKEPIDYWVLDWKGIPSEQKQKLVALLEQTDIPFIKRKQLKKILLTSE